MARFGDYSPLLDKYHSENALRLKILDTWLDEEVSKADHRFFSILSDKAYVLTNQDGLKAVKFSTDKDHIVYSLEWISDMSVPQIMQYLIPGIKRTNEKYYGDTFGSYVLEFPTGSGINAETVEVNLDEMLPGSQAEEVVKNWLGAFEHEDRFHYYFVSDVTLKNGRPGTRIFAESKYDHSDWLPNFVLETRVDRLKAKGDNKLEEDWQISELLKDFMSHYSKISGPNISKEKIILGPSNGMDSQGLKTVTFFRDFIMQ